MVGSHGSVRLWWALWLRCGCSCGRVRPCLPPDLRVSDAVGDRLPDGGRVLWPVNARPTRAGAVTWELSVRPEATLPHRYRPWGRWSV